MLKDYTVSEEKPELKEKKFKEDIPMICNWTCPGFETVGYGYYD